MGMRCLGGHKQENSWLNETYLLYYINYDGLTSIEKKKVERFITCLDYTTC